MSAQRPTATTRPAGKGTAASESEPPLRGQAARWAGQRERRRSEFVEAALGVIAEQGPAVSVEDIAARVGVARTRLYRHFVDRADLERAITARVAGLVVAELDALWHPHGSARQMISSAIGAYVGWLDRNRQLHAYLLGHPGAAEDVASYSGVRRAVAEHLTGLFGGYLDLLDVDPAVAVDLAHAVVGMIESVVGRWVSTDASSVDGVPVSAEVVIARLAAWTWALLADVLGDAGLRLDPDLPLPPLIGLVPPAGTGGG